MYRSHGHKCYNILFLLHNCCTHNYNECVLCCVFAIISTKYVYIFSREASQRTALCLPSQGQSTVSDHYYPLSYYYNNNYLNETYCICICSCSDSQVQAQTEAVTEDDLRLIQERELAITQLEVKKRESHFCSSTAVPPQLFVLMLIMMAQTLATPQVLFIVNIYHFSLCSLI